MAWTQIGTVTYQGVGAPFSYAFDTDKFDYRIRYSRTGDIIVQFVERGEQKLIPNGQTLDITNLVYKAPTRSSMYIVSDVSYHAIVESQPKNTAPTTPGSFTLPTGTLETGDVKTVAWGASTDADGNFKNYVLEASVNNGAWSQIATPTVPSHTYTVPTATSVKFRVKAVDTGGLQSAYRDSSVFTVTKPMYYWNKYNIEVVKRYVEGVLGSPSSTLFGLAPGIYNSYAFDPINGYSGVGIPVSIQPNSAAFDGKFTIPFKERLYKIIGSTGSMDGSSVRVTVVTADAKLVDVDTRGALVQSGIAAAEGIYPLDGRHTDSFWYVRGARVNQSIAPPGAFTSPAGQSLLQPKQVITLAFGASTAAAISAYEVESRYNNGAWATVGTHTNALTRAFTVTDNKSLVTVEFRVRAKNTSNVYSDYVYSEAFVIEHNKIPVVTLNTENNKTLYENDAFVINGSAVDSDVGDIVNVYYRLNVGTARAIATGISSGAAIPFNEQLTFKAGKLYKGEIAITDALAEGPAHQLEVWSEDNQGGKSTIAERTFYVVPNRPPALTVDPFTDQAGMINNDTITLSGASSDPDGNDVTVSYKLNSNAAVQIHSGVAGPWTFVLSLKSLKDGENIIIVEVTDTYSFKSSKTIKLHKTANLTPLSASVQRYEIMPPSGSAQGVLLWIQRDISQTITAEISMTTGSEQEQFASMTLSNTAPVSVGIVEDEFTFQAVEAKENIFVKLNITGTGAVTLISGVLS